MYVCMCVCVYVSLARSTLLRSCSSASSFKFSDLEITECPADKRRPKPDWNNLVFGTQFSDHMFEVQRSWLLLLYRNDNDK